MTEFLIFLFFGTAMFLLGAIWKDRKAAKVERDLKSRIEAQRILLQNKSSEVKLHREFITSQNVIDGIMDEVKVASKRRDESPCGSEAYSINRGVVRGLLTAMLRVRGSL